MSGGSTATAIRSVRSRNLIPPILAAGGDRRIERALPKDKPMPPLDKLERAVEPLSDSADPPDNDDVSPLVFEGTISEPPQ